MSLFSDNIEDDFDDFDDLQKELSKPKKNPLPPLSSNQSKGVLPSVSKQTKREQSQNLSSFPSLTKPANKDSFPLLNKKSSDAKFPSTNKNELVNDLQDDQYEFDDFENDQFQNTTNKFAANLDLKAKQFEQMSKNIQSLETSIHKLPKKESKKSSRAGTGMIGDDDDDDDDFQEFAQSGNNLGLKQNKPQVQTEGKFYENNLKFSLVDSKPKLSIEPKHSLSKEFNKKNMINKKNIKKQDADIGDDQFRNISVPKLIQQKRQNPPKFQALKQKKKPMFLNDQTDEKPKKVLTKSSNSRSSKQIMQNGGTNLFQKKKMPKQNTESASILIPIHKKQIQKKAKKDLKSIRQNRFDKNNVQASPLSTQGYPTKVNGLNINLQVEHTIQLAREKVAKMQAAEKQLLNSQDAQDVSLATYNKQYHQEEKLYSYYQRENKSLRQELKGLNGSLNKLIQAFDASNYMAKQKRQARSFSQRPTSKHRFQVQQDQAKNNQKILINVQREYDRLFERLQQVKDAHYIDNLQKKVEEQAQQIKKYKVKMKKITNSQRELEKKMDGFIDNDDQECVLKVQDLSNQVTVLKNALVKKEKQLQRSAVVMQKFKSHNQQVLNTYHKLVKIAQHYEIDFESAFSQTGQASTIPSSLPSSTKNTKLTNQQLYQKLEKKLKSAEQDANKLMNKIKEMKKTKKTLISRKQQLQLQFFSKLEQNQASHQMLHELIKKFKSTGDSSTIRIVEKWESSNKDLLAPKENLIKMMRANLAAGIDRKTPHVIKDGSVVIQGKPLRASGNSKGLIANYEGKEPRRGPPNQSLLSVTDNMIQEDIMMQTDISAITKKVNNHLGSDQDFNKILTPRNANDQAGKNINDKAASGLGSKPFVIKKGKFSKLEDKKKEIEVMEQDIPDEIVVTENEDQLLQSQKNNLGNVSSNQKFQERVEKREEIIQQEKPTINKPSFASKPFGKPFGKNNKGKPNLKPNFNIGGDYQQKQQPKAVEEESKNVFNLDKKDQQFGIKQDNEVKNRRNSPPISSDPFAKFDNYDPLEKYNNTAETKQSQRSNKKTHSFLNDSNKMQKEFFKGEQSSANNKKDFEYNFSSNRDNLQLQNNLEHQQSEFDDLDFENTERKASVMQNDEALAFLNKNDANKKPADNWPEVQNPPTKQELAPNNNNNQDLDFEDLDF